MTGAGLTTRGGSDSTRCMLDHPYLDRCIKALRPKGFGTACHDQTQKAACRRPRLEGISAARTFWCPAPLAMLGRLRAECQITRVGMVRALCEG